MKGNANNKMSGCIIAANDDMVTVQFSEDVSSYRSGQHVMVSIPYDRKTALENVVSIAEIIAHGEISDIAGDIVTIKSNRANPIISKFALRDGFGKECVMIVEVLD